jgi:spore maturation protein CgeB
LGDSPLNPSIETIKALKSVGIKTVFMWPDTSRWAIGQIVSLDGIADLSVSWDNAYSQTHNSFKYPDNHINLWVPQDHSMFSFVYQSGKSIDVSFIGSVYSDRAMFLGNSSKNISIYGGQRNKRLSSYEYANIIKNSKISINFPLSPCGSFHQIKGRVYEIFSCGSMLLERKNPVTSKLFVPGQDYIEFDSVKEMDDAIEHFVNNEYDRERISISGCIKYINFYGSKKFWDAIINEIY